MSENRLIIDNKKTNLTHEQLEPSLENKKKSPFERAEQGTIYYSITSDGKVVECCETGDDKSEALYNAGNYCTDKILMEQRALQEKLGRLLWIDSMQHGGAECNWYDSTTQKWLIQHDRGLLCLNGYYSLHGIGEVPFANASSAQAAVDRIVIPFKEQYPELKW